MALFPGSPDAAVRAVFEFEEFLKEFNARLESQGRKAIHIGSGIHTGDLILGTIGHDNRLETTVISDSVNTAARVEGLTKYYQARAICTEATLNQLSETGDMPYRFLDVVKVKGKSKSFPVYELLSSYDQEKIKYLDTYNKGMKHWRRKELIEAAHIFADLLQRNPADRALEILLEKYKNFLKQNNSIWSESD